jgi:hypothetical protein
MVKFESSGSRALVPVHGEVLQVDLRRSANRDSSAGSRLLKKILIGIAAMLVLALSGYFALRGATPDQTLGALKMNAARSVLGPSPAEWADLSLGHLGGISLLVRLRKSVDYDLEVEDSLGTQPLKWALRVQDARNFSVSMLSLERSGAKKVLRAVHYAVIDGLVEKHSEAVSDAPGTSDGIYKIHFAAKADRFVVFVGDRKVDEWSDGRIRTGGPGLFRESAGTDWPQGGFRVVAVTAGDPRN